MIWFLAVLSMSIVSNLQLTKSLSFCVIVITGILSGMSTIVSVVITHLILKNYHLSFQNQLLRIFNYQNSQYKSIYYIYSQKTYILTDSQNPIPKYRTQTLGIQSKKFIIKVFGFVAMMCLIFTVCAYQLMAMRYDLKIATAIIFIVTPLIDVLILRQILLFIMTVIHRINLCISKPSKNTKRGDENISMNNVTLKRFDLHG